MFYRYPVTRTDNFFKFGKWWANKVLGRYWDIDHCSIYSIDYDKTLEATLTDFHITRGCDLRDMFCAVYIPYRIQASHVPAYSRCVTTIWDWLALIASQTWNTPIPGNSLWCTALVWDMLSDEFSVLTPDELLSKLEDYDMYVMKVTQPLIDCAEWIIARGGCYLKNYPEFSEHQIRVLVTTGIASRRKLDGKQFVKVETSRDEWDTLYHAHYAGRISKHYDTILEYLAVEPATLRDIRDYLGIGDSASNNKVYKLVAEGYVGKNDDGKYYKI